MAEPTQTETTEEETVPTAFGWCHWHQGNTDGIRLIDVIEQGSGSGITHFACAPCRGVHGLVPFADQP
ncbi:hypothetical protein [Streptomyces sp. P9-A2]|uniref:hypothetical protein n=1 Tax=Streptomyces sp. P9-A2 TaxID=3072284 RepID=UPI002FC7EB1F